MKVKTTNNSIYKLKAEIALVKNHVIFIFLDGVGIGKNDVKVNPFFNARMPAFVYLCGGRLPQTPFMTKSSSITDVIAVNATLGIAGLPQSGTGQTAIFTGVNGAKKFGRHFGPHPPSILRPIIAEKNIFQQLKIIGKSVVFANAFPQKFLDYKDSGQKRLTVTTLSYLYAGFPLLTADDLRRNEAISPDFIRSEWASLGHLEIEKISPMEAGRHLCRIAQKHDFTLFEYWLTDHAGHKQSMNYAVEILEKLDEFLFGFLDSFDPSSMLLMITSDHGNIEDLSTKSHTRNRVPCIIAGKNKNRLAKRIKNLTHITPAILRLFNS